MDIALERILSLIPKKPNGEFVHGSLKAFANSIGLKSGNLISDWINDRSRSYTNYLYEIAMKYNVSVEWLKGETDDPTPLTGEGQKNNRPDTQGGKIEEFMQLFSRLSPEDQERELAYLRSRVGE